jgi:hypothetical protein
VQVVELLNPTCKTHYTRSVRFLIRRQRLWQEML